jgi:hypothetical protein
LFGPGELRALRVGDADVFRLVLAMLRPLSGDGAAAIQAAQAVASLSVVELTGYPTVAEDEVNAAAVIERCAATVTELRGPLPVRLLCESDRVGHPPVLARCTRLEVLACARDYAAVWLGLSQLHTLQDVDLNVVSTAAIAAALPRLHTLTTYGEHVCLDKVAGFFTDLLPRLRVFHFTGTWSVEPATSAVAPLPQLQELIWVDHTYSVRIPLPTAFLGARPTVLHAPYELVVKSLPTHGDAPGEPASSFLARVCVLHVYTYTPVSVSAVAQVIRAAPRLRTFICALHPGDMQWITTPTAPLHPAFVGLVHPRLRYLGVATRVSASSGDGCASRLQRTCFPRLLEMKVGDVTFFATPDETARDQVADTRSGSPRYSADSDDKNSTMPPPLPPL